MKPDDFIMTTAGIRMPKIIYGTAWKKERTAELVEQAIDLGFRGIDTACQPKHYHEAGVGDGIAACIKRGLITRPELYLQTKFTSLAGQDPRRIPYDPKVSLSEQVSQSFEVSLANLQTTYLDCLVLHSPMTSTQLTLEVWLAMEKLVKSGDVKQLGISNCYELDTLAVLFHASEIKPAIIQNRFYDKTAYDGTIRAFCKENGIIYQSFWTLTANPHVLADYSVQCMATKYGLSAAQVFFRYLTQIGIVPLTGTTSASHMLEDLSIFDFELNSEECDTIGALL
jgi:diketogulonate reductase-like aldo/keto reductase